MADRARESIADRQNLAGDHEPAPGGSVPDSPGLISWQCAASVGAFLVPGLALWLPSGYSWGAGWLLLCALLATPLWWRHPLAPGTRRLMLLIGIMGLLWSVDMGPEPGFISAEPLLKYLAALACLGFLSAAPPQPGALWAGVAIGGIGSGILALVQVLGQGMERAHGFLNAIQYGDLSLLIGLMALVALIALWEQLPRLARASLSAGAVLGMLGSLASQTRGGWLALLLAGPVAAVLLARHGLGRRVTRTILGAIAALLLSLPLMHHQLGARLQLVDAEVRAYVEGHEVATSIGQRLEHWQLAWRMGMERPLLGWGRAYDAEKQRRVEAHKAHPVVLEFSHAHNEWLDMYARRGLLGVLLLLLYLLFPLWLFWPTPARVTPPGQAGMDPTLLALSLVGSLLPLGYLGFGLTQVFFGHNSGHMFYLFMLILVQAMLSGRRTAAADRR